MIFRLFFLLTTAVSLFLVDDPKAQIIQGQVFDNDSKEIVPFANIYFSSTMHGTTSDHDGFFELSTDGYVGQDIVISCVGYDTWTSKNFQKDKFYKIYLKPSSNLLREVMVVHHDMPREKKEKIFLHEFLGTSRNASQCYIENLDDVILTYFKTSSTLEAYSFKPLIIRNEALGYKIKYFLDSFMVDSKNMFYQGNFLFEEIETSDINEKEKLNKRREKAYYGSRMHFFRVLWQGNTGNKNYILEAPGSAKSLKIDSLVSGDNYKIKYLMPNYGRQLVITYRGFVSYVVFIGDNGVPFSQSGFFDSQGINWRGKMAQQRIGDLLPFEYWPYM